ncbi:RCC1 domain-containing protein [Acidobacteriota bacterium]
MNHVSRRRWGAIFQPAASWTAIVLCCLTVLSEASAAWALQKAPPIACGGYHSLAMACDGTAWAWGRNLDGQLGDGSTAGSNIPVHVRDASGTGILTGIVALAGGGFSTLALMNDGTVMAFGGNQYGQLGNGTYIRSILPQPVLDPTDPTSILTQVTAIAAGNFHGVALKCDGTVWTWGWNEYGQLGNGENTNSTLPVQVIDPADPSGFLTGVTALDSDGDSYHTLVLKEDGTVFGWGFNRYGQLGNAENTDNTNLPVQVMDPTDPTGFLTDVIAVACGGVHSLVLKRDGTVYACGYNRYGELGDGTYTNANLPVQVRNMDNTGFLTGITAIAGGGTVSVALSDDTTLWAWGRNQHGQLGNGATSNSSLPVRVRNHDNTGILDNVTAVCAGSLHALAVTGDNAAWDWGQGDKGQLGNGASVDQHLPVRVRDETGEDFLDACSEWEAPLTPDYCRNAVDIKPGSCPNPLNPRSRGRLPVAILGSDGFDVITIDPSTIRLLEVVEPRSKFSFEDTSSRCAELDPQDECSCCEGVPDGYVDLVVHFAIEDVVAALGGEESLEPDQVIMIPVSGQLRQEYGGREFEGMDCMIVVGGPPS